MTKSKKRVLHVRSVQTGEIVKSVDVHDKSQRSVEKVMLGMLRNMSEDFYVDDSEIQPAKEAR